MKYDFSKFCKIYEEKGLVNPRHLIPKEYEIEAKREYGKIDLNDLEVYFVNVMTTYWEKNKKAALKYYNAEVGYIKRMFDSNSDVKNELDLKRRNLIKTFRKNFYHYSRILEEFKKNKIEEIDKIQYVSKRFISLVQAIDYYGDKLVFIHNFEKMVDKAIEYEERIALAKSSRHQPRIEFRNIFKNPSDYSMVINKLKENQTIIDDSSGKFTWISKTTDTKLKVKKLVGTLGFILLDKGLLNTTKNTVINRCLYDEFDVKLSDKYFGNILENLAVKSNFKNSECVKYFHFLI